MSPMAGHVASDRLGEASLHGGLETLREEERHHVQGCDSCRRLYGGYRLADRLLAAPWREVKVPVGAATRPSRFAFVGDFVRGLDARSVAPVAAAIGLVVLIGAAVALPQLIPVTPVSSHSPIASRPTATASPSPSAPAHLSPVPSSSAQAGRTPGAQASGNGSSNGGPGATTPAGPTSAPSAEASAQLAVSKISGSPIAWSPDGAHLLLWAAGFAHEIQICDAAGHVTGTAAADAATWVSSTTVAVATRAPIGPSGRSGGSRGGSGGSGEMVVLVNVHGQVTRTLPGRYTLFGGVANGMLLGSGSGELTIEGAGGGTSSGSGFVLWNGSLSGVQDGLPIAFSADGRKLAVLDLSGVSGGSVTGTLEILSIPSLSTSASFDHLNLRVGSGSLGSAFGFDAAFSPNGASLLASGTLVDLSSDTSTQVGKGGWLPDGTLVTASSGGVLRWQGTHATVDPRLPGAGTVETSRHGELIYFYPDSRPPLLLDTDGTVSSLSLSGVRSIGNLLISPTGRSIVLAGRTANGSSITGLATLP